MLAYTYQEKNRFILEEKERPRLQNPQDAIVRVTLASICVGLFFAINLLDLR